MGVTADEETLLEAERFVARVIAVRPESATAPT